VGTRLTDATSQILCRRKDYKELILVSRRLSREEELRAKEALPGVQVTFHRT
jgi:hypothetical protein